MSWRADRRLAGCAVAAALVLAVLGPGAGEERRSPTGEGVFKRGVLGGRGYRLFVPADAREPGAPLVLALHGCWQTPEDFATGTRLNDAAARRRLLVLYPAQGRRGNPSRCWNWFEPEHQKRCAGETGQILALVEEVRKQYGLERGKVVVLGFSAGGFMAVNLACAAPDVIAGVGIAAGGPYRCGLGAEGALSCMRGPAGGGGPSAEACLGAMEGRPHAIRASLWHGERDVVVSATNLDALAAMFAPLAGARAIGAERRDGALHTTYRDGQGRAVIETWLVPGMGHAWSGGDPRGTHTYPLGPSATERMLDFLLTGPPGGS
ncbi:MAG: PHB depolymerase family esterase [Candidatus Rokubacteria bacterium]|nr:PHB depolymerase family esterase [Candidatus Rokubacteria bacterium]